MAAKTCRMRSGKHEHIHSDVMENILTHLPVKSLLRFRSVQKSWNSLITTNPEFKAKHYKARLQSHISGRIDVLLVFTKDYDHFIDFIESWDSSNNTLQTCLVIPPRTNNKPTQASFRFVTVANGIVMMNASYWDHTVNLCLLWNPATRKFFYLPRLELRTREYCSQGFGFEHQSQHFKVVGDISWNRDDQGVFVQVYSSKTGGSWNLIRTKFHFLPQRQVSLEGFCQKGGYLDGKFYWLGEEQTAGEIFPALDIIEFDFETYSFKVTPVPESINIINREAKYVTVDLIVYKETLTLLTSNLVHGRKVCDIWTMIGEDDYGVLMWEKKSSLSLDGLSMEEHLGRPRALMTLRNGKQGIVFGSPGVVDQWALLQQPAYGGLPERELVLFDPSNSQVSAYPSVEVRDYWQLLRVTNYVESLFCIEANTSTAKDDRVDNTTFHQVLNKIANLVELVRVPFLLLLFFIFIFLGLHYIAKHHILVALKKHYKTNSNC